jgi:hypothetical protein
VLAGAHPPAAAMVPFTLWADEIELLGIAFQHPVQAKSDNYFSQQGRKIGINILNISPRNQDDERQHTRNSTPKLCY